MLSRHDGFMWYGILEVYLSSTSELLHPNMKTRLRLIRARPIFYMISDNPNVSLGIVDCSFYTRRNALKDDYHKKRMDKLAYAPVEFIFLEMLAKTFIILATKIISFKKTFSTMLQFVGLLLQLIKTQHSLDHTLKIHFGIHSLNSDKLEYSEEASRS